MEECFKLLERYNLWQGAVPDTGCKRPLYTDKLVAMTGNRLVKVLAGQRRCGKSYILRQVAMALLDRGVDKRNIFMFNKELEAFSFITDDKVLDELFRYYEEKMKPQGKVYIFLDEVQNINCWERFVNSYSQDYMHDYELFITGSNSRMFSGQLATLLSGRYVRIDVLPFSYDEYLSLNDGINGAASYKSYLSTTGMPEMFRLPDDEARRYYVSALKDTVLLRDIVSRYMVRDVDLLETLFRYVVNNVSNLLSVNSIVKYVKGQGKKVTYDTVATYLRYIEDAYLVYRVDRYDIKGKALLGGSAKYYANDLAFRNYLYRGFGYGDGYLLENAIYLDMRRLGFDVYVGTAQAKEVDFVGVMGDRKIYVQVAYTIADEETARREYASLEAIADNYEKYLVTLDDRQLPMNEGIRHVQAWNFFDTVARF